jgi:hypothetical protein
MESHYQRNTSSCQAAAPNRGWWEKTAENQEETELGQKKPRTRKVALEELTTVNLVISSKIGKRRKQKMPGFRSLDMQIVRPIGLRGNRG